MEETKQYVTSWTVEQIKEMYIAYGGDLYVLWHDYGNAFFKACQYYGISKEDMEKWIQ